MSVGRIKFAMIRRWASDPRGGIATTFAMALPVIFAALGLASDYAMMTMVRSELQAAADAAAMAGAREIPLARKNADQVTSVAKSFAAYTLTKDAATTASALALDNITVEAAVIEDFSMVKVDISESWTPFFAHFVASGITPVTVSATAKFLGRNNICVLGLGGGKNTVFLDRNARLTGNGCGVFSNSKAADGLAIKEGVTLKAAIVCSGGGASVSGSASVQPEVLTDCPQVKNPLDGRPPPSSASCDYNDKVYSNVTVTLDPGVYCGGLKIDGDSVATLQPGIYIIKDGALVIAGSTRLTGVGVGFFITGDAGSTIITSKTHVSLTAPTAGPMAGLLIYEDPALSVNLKHRISSDDARTLLGTIYLPVGSLIVDAKETVADQSAYTAIVARSVELNMGPNLVLNAYYDMTDVPVPEGIAGSSQVVLSN